MGLEVPELGYKFALLRRYGPLKDWKTLADRFEVKPKTMKWWVNGDKTRNPGVVTRWHVPALMNVFREALPKTLSSDEVRGLVLGNAQALERALAADKSPSIDDLIASEAITGTASLRRGKGLGLVEHDRGETGAPSVKLDERFVIEYQTGKSGYALALQHAQQDWGVIKFADGKVSKKHPGGPLLVPGLRKQEFVFLYEPASVGPHRFILFISPQPFPLAVTQPAAAGKSLDWTALSELARHFTAQPKHLRELHLLPVTVTRN